MPRFRYLRSYLWSFINSGGTQIIGFLSTILIARIASPADFGLIAICSAIVLMSNILSEGGLASSVIVNKEFSIKKASTILIIVAAVSIFLFSIVVGFASELARIFQQSRVAEILPFMALSILANGFRCVHSAVLVRRLEFKKLSLISLLCVSVGSSIGVVVAYLHEPLFGLVLVFILTPIINTAALWIYAPWGFYIYCKPRLLYSDIGFSLNVTLSSFLDQGSKSMLVFLLNGRFGVSDLGFYSRADAIKNLATQTLDKVVQRVSFPVLSKQNHESLDIAAAGHVKISAILVLILMPLTYLFLSYSEGIIYIVYGPHWGESAAILEKIAFLGFFVPLTSQNLTLFKALGVPKIMTWNKGVGLLLLPVVFLLIDSPQILGVLGGIVIYAVALFFISFISLVFFSVGHMISYVKYVFCAGMISLGTVSIHYFILEMSFENAYFNILINGASLLVTMAVFYYALFLLIVGNKNVKS
jgi:O-antigen/teichoic acid export membrane protein